MTENRRFRRGYALACFVGVLAGDALRYSITWYGWVAVALALAAIAVVILVRERHRWTVSGLPWPLIAFVVLILASIAWSAYPQWSALGVLAAYITIIIAACLAIAFTADELIWAFGTGLRVVLGLSLLFELVISVFVRQPILPWWENAWHSFGNAPIHASYYWSRDLLFTGGRIQGLVGNSNLLGFLGLLGLIVFAIQLAAKRVRLVPGIFWLVVALLCIALTRSGTVTVALFVVAVVTAVLLLVRHARTERGRGLVYAVSGGVIVLGVVAAVVFPKIITGALGKSSTFTGRTQIWNTVIHFAQQRPAVGWGWVSYWVPNVYPFDSKKFTLGGVGYLQAHEAWLDIWLQLGIVGLVVFGSLVLSTIVRVWVLAVERGGYEATGRGPHTAQTLLPVLILVALLAQSLAESRLLIEYGMLLVCFFAIRSKRDLTEAEAL